MATCLSLLGSTAAAARTTYLPCAPKGTDGIRELVLKDRPSTCTIISKHISNAGAVALREARWKNWGKATATGTAIERGVRATPLHIPVKVRLDHIAFDCNGRPYYSHFRATSRYGTTENWIAPGCDYTHFRSTFSTGVYNDLSQVTATDAKVSGVVCDYSAPGRWRCEANAEWKQRDESDSRGFVYCEGRYRGHFTATYKLIIDVNPPCEVVG